MQTTEMQTTDMQTTKNDKQFIDLKKLDESSSLLLTNTPRVMNEENYHSIILSRNFRKCMTVDLPSRATTEQINSIVRRLKIQTLNDMANDTEITDVIGHIQTANPIDELITLRIYLIIFPLTIFEQLKAYNIKKCKIYIGHSENPSELMIIKGRLEPNDEELCNIDRNNNVCPCGSSLVYTIE